MRTRYLPSDPFFSLVNFSRDREKYYYETDNLLEYSEIFVRILFLAEFSLDERVCFDYRPSFLCSDLETNEIIIIIFSVLRD